MAIEGEIMTIHQKIAEAHAKHSDDYFGTNSHKMRVFDAPKISDIDEIKQVLQYILDKLHGMEQFLRMNYKPYKSQMFNSSPDKPIAEVKEFPESDLIQPYAQI